MKTVRASTAFAWITPMLLAGCASLASPNPARSIEGVWKAVEIDVPSGPYQGTHVADVQPSLFIFTRSHYSILSVGGFAPRPVLTVNPRTVEEYAAVFTTFTGNGGGYRVEGNKLVITPTVGAWPAFMDNRPRAAFEVDWQGPDLWLVTTMASGEKSRTRLKRVKEG